MLCQYVIHGAGDGDAIGVIPEAGELPLQQRTLQLLKPGVVPINFLAKQSQHFIDPWLTGKIAACPINDLPDTIQHAGGIPPESRVPSQETLVYYIQQPMQGMATRDKEPRVGQGEGGSQGSGFLQNGLQFSGQWILF